MSILFQDTEVMKFVYAELSATNFDTWPARRILGDHQDTRQHLLLEL